MNGYKVRLLISLLLLVIVPTNTTSQPNRKQCARSQYRHAPRVGCLAL